MTGAGGDEALVRPFSGRIVRSSWATRVVSPLHDVLSTADRRAILAANPDTFLHVTSDPEDLPDAGLRDDHDADPNAIALQRLLALGAYGPRVQPAVFAYRMKGLDRRRTGLVAEVAVRGFADGRVLGHEDVQPDRVDRLARRFERVPMQSDLLSLLHRDDQEVAALTAAACAGPVLLELTDVSGVHQAVWPVSAADSVELAGRLSELPLYIADGHHRVAAALQRWELAGRPDDASVLCAIYAEEQVRLYAFHRRVRGPIAVTELVAELARGFAIEPATGPTRTAGAIGLYAGGRWSRLVAREPGLAALDVTVLDEQVLRPVLAVERGDPRLEFVPELADLETAVRACDEDGGALFTLAAMGVDDLVAVAERGEVMSAKSTYVEPKPRTGIFLL
jgi:uncharacterized protein (DUF1015 family)